MYHHTDLIKLPDAALHHCASITVYPQTIWVALYFGKECSDEQRVMVCINDGPKESPYQNGFCLEGKTGNPLIFTYKNQVYLLCSKFEDNSEIVNLVDRWKYCSNHLYKLERSWNKDVPIKCEYVGKIDKLFGLLARCAPIEYNGKLLIPLYREKDPVCEVWEFDGEFKFISRFGEVSEQFINDNQIIFGRLGDGIAIQPSLFVGGPNATQPFTIGNLYAICRNVTRSHNNAWLYETDDMKNWRQMDCAELNLNSSLVVAQSPDRTKSLFIKSSDIKKPRTNMLMTNKGITMNLAVPISDGGSFSYPNYYWDRNYLYVVHSNCNSIAVHTFDEEILKAMYGFE